MTRRKVADLHPGSRARHILPVICILVGVASLSGVDVSPDLRKIDPALMIHGVAEGISTPQGVSRAGPDRGAPLSVFIRLASDDIDLPAQVRYLGGTARKIQPRIYAASLPPDATRYLSNRPAVRYIEPDRVARPMLDVSRPAVSANLVHQGVLPPLPQPFRGENTFVGVVDTGLDGDHPDFNGRIAHTFSVSGLDPLLDSNGHGTHVTGIAAGDGFASAETYTGMAPGASLLIGRAGRNDFQTSDILAAINNLLQFAGATPVAINLSLGLVHGPHDGTSSFETAVDSLAAGAAGSKRIITVAAGNERGNNEHFHATVPPFGLTTLAVSFAEGTTNAEVEIWADGEDEYSVTATIGGNSITVPSGRSGNTSGISLLSNKVSSPPNGDTLISVNFLPVAGTPTATIQMTRTRNGGTGIVDGYVDGVFDGTFQVATDTGTVTEPANAENVIAVGSFDTKQHSSGQPDPTEGISSFSSLGPTRDGRIKPDLAAPGFVIYSARSSDAPEGNYDFGVVDNNYAILAGTSMGTAHVTGVASLVWQSNQLLTNAQIRERLKRTADTPSDGSAPPNNTWGYGKVNAFRAVTEPVASITAPPRTTPNTQVPLTSENSSGPLGAAITVYEWNGIPGGSDTTFQEAVPGDYAVSLVVISNGTRSMKDTRTIRVNHVPLASISGPTAVDNVTSVPFTGTGSDDDSSQDLSFHWILLKRPADSSSTLTTADADSVTLVPDVSGRYELGLRVNDGLDDSTMATHTIAVAVPSSADGGGGGCSVQIGEGAGDAASAVAALILLLAPLGVLRAGKRAYRLPRR